MLKRILVLLLFISSFSFAEVATTDDLRILKNDLKDDIQMLSNQITETNKVMLKMIESNQKATNQRFEDINKRFEEMNNKFYMIMALLVIIIGYLMKERQIIKKEILQEVKEIIEKKADKKFVDDIITVIEDFAKTNTEIADVLQKHKIRVN